MLIKIIVESASLIERTKKDKSGTYYLQEVWAYTYGPNGLHPHPERVELFPPKDDTGAPVAYPVGEYFLALDSVGVRYNRLEIFTRLTPADKALQDVKRFLAGIKSQAA